MRPVLMRGHHLRRVAPAQLMRAAPCVGWWAPGPRWSSGEAGDELKRRRLWRWGSASTGMLKSADKDIEISQEPLLLEDFRGMSAAACGANHSAFVVDGQLYTYGSNKYAQLGRSVGEGESSNDPGLVAFDDETAKVTQISLGDFHTAAITGGGVLWTWGWGGSFWSGAGALGLGTKESVEAPTKVQQFVDSGEAIVQVECGGQHTLVLTEAGRVYSTGKGEFGRLGHGDTRDETTFKEIEYFDETNDTVLAEGEPVKIVKIGAGNNYSAALSSSGELRLWGRNDYGQLGLGEEAMGDMYSAERYPRLVRSLPTEGLRIVDFACGTYQIVVLTDQGTLYEWGGKTWLEPHEVPIGEEDKEKLKSIKKLAAGDKFTFMITADGAVYSWGAKASGCLAQGAECPKIVVEPAPVPAGTFGHQPVVDIVASGSRCLAISLEDGYVA